MFRWYVINTYSGHENKVKANLEHRVKSMTKEEQVRRVVVPTESVVETKDGQKVQTERRLWPGYVLVHMDLNDDVWGLVKNTPGETGFVGASGKPVPLSQPEVDRMLHTSVDAPSSSRRRAPSSRSATTSRSRPATWPTSTARSPRSTRTRASSRCSSRSSSARRRSSWSSTRSRSFRPERPTVSRDRQPLRA